MLLAFECTRLYTFLLVNMNQKYQDCSKIGSQILFLLVPGLPGIEMMIPVYSTQISTTTGLIPYAIGAVFR